LESAANAIVITSRRGGIQWVNPAFLALNGYSAAEVLSSNVRMLGSGQHSPAFYKGMWKYISRGRMWRGEIINRRKDGGLYTADLTITPVRDEAGEIINFISILQDVTERKQAERDMLEAREAVARAERLSALGIMAAGIAHEINQPLNSLKVMADGTLYWYRQGKVPEIDGVMETVQEISKEADRIDQIIKHMRSFVHNSGCAEPELCDLNRAVRESLTLIGAQLSTHGIEVKTDLAADLPPIFGNSTQLEQIVINLVVNAMQALDTVNKGGKEISIVTGWKKGNVFLAVSDNGPGISKEIKDKIFNPFFTTKSAGGGMGLGLSIVQSIVSCHGGEIKLRDGKARGGATFQIDFPVGADKNRKGGKTE
jgi:PAS domain S-box-containing protein